MKDQELGQQKQSYLLHISLRFELEMAKSEIGRLKSAVKRWCQPAMHGNRLIAFVIVTEETATELRERLMPTLETLSCIDDFWIYPAPEANDIVGRAGAFSPMCHWVRLAWVEARKRPQARYMRYAQRR